MTPPTLGTLAQSEHDATVAALANTLLTAGISPQRAARSFRVPGRVELVGKHVDYAGGRSLTCAIDRGFTAVSMRRTDNRVSIIDLGRGVTDRFSLAPDLEVPRGWSAYPRTVARRLVRDFDKSKGVDLAFTSNLPAAAGLSSSSALVILTWWALADANHLDHCQTFHHAVPTQLALAEYLAAVERGQPFGPLSGDYGVGTLGGAQDHVAILCNRAGHIGQFSYRPATLERSIPWPAGHMLVIAPSGVKAAKAGNVRRQYNQLSKDASTVLDLWRTATGRADPHLAAIASVPDAADRFREIITRHASATTLLQRWEQFHQETAVIVPAAGIALAGGALTTFGELVDRSQQLAASHLGNQVPETIFLARSARQEGAVAASGFGGGFGGAVWALVRVEDAQKFIESWSHSYVQAYPEHGESNPFSTSIVNSPA